MEPKYKFGKSSINRLNNVHPKLQELMYECIKYSPIDFSIVQGLRTIEEQIDCVKRGVSKTFNSHHLYGLAIDFAPYVNGKINWEHKNFHPIIDHIKKTARELNINITSGADKFKSFIDLPHIQLEGEEKDPKIIKELKERGLIK